MAKEMAGERIGVRDFASFNPIPVPRRKPLPNLHPALIEIAEEQEREADAVRRQEVGTGAAADGRCGMVNDADNFQRPLLHLPPPRYLSFMGLLEAESIDGDIPLDHLVVEPIGIRKGNMKLVSMKQLARWSWMKVVEIWRCELNKMKDREVNSHHVKKV